MPLTSIDNPYRAPPPVTSTPLSAPRCVKKFPRQMVIITLVVLAGMSLLLHRVLYRKEALLLRGSSIGSFSGIDSIDPLSSLSRPPASHISPNLPSQSLDKRLDKMSDKIGTHKVKDLSNLQRASEDYSMNRKVPVADYNHKSWKAQHVHTSPELHENAVPPLKHEETPPKHEDTQVKREEAPVKQEEVPPKHEDAPMKHEEIPPKHGDAPMKHEEVPPKHEETPVKREEALVKHEDVPPKHEDTLVKHEEAPVKHEGVPPKHEGAPEVHEAVPPKHEDTPVKHEEVPPKHEDTPVKHEETPPKHEDTPVKHEEVPLKHEDTPVKHEETPPKHEDTPVKHEEVSLKHEDTPVKQEGVPPKHEDTLVKHEEASVKHEEVPLKHEGAPEVHEAVPPKLEVSSVKQEEAPVKHEDIPVKREEAPLKHEDTPVKQEEAPAKREDTPVKHEEVPPNHVDTPVKPDNPPARADGTFVKQEEITVKHEDVKRSGGAELAAILSAQEKPVSDNAHAAELDSGVKEKLTLWLNGDSVESVAGRVSSWRDVSRRASSRTFRPLSDAHSVQASSALVKEYKRDISRHKENNGALPSSPQSYSTPLTNHAGVHFPCALEYEDKAFRLSETSTMFFVIKPEYPGKDDHSPGQRFFGHYPSGQFRLLNGEASFHANGADYTVPEGGAALKHSGVTNLLAYRFSPTGVEISVNGQPFYPASPSDWTATNQKSLFTHNSPLYVGGVTQACGFIGDVNEVMVFNSALSEREVSPVFKYLSGKYTFPDAIPGPAVVARPDRDIHTQSKDRGEKLRVTTSDNVIHKDTSTTTTATSQVQDNQNALHIPAQPEPHHSMTRPKEVVNNVHASSGKESGDKKNVCDSNEDPYKDVAIENYTPPKGADLKDVMMWEDAVADLKERIRKMTVGGDALRNIIRKEVRAMQLLRFKTFCQYY